jgi:hypothetical protein
MMGCRAFENIMNHANAVLAEMVAEGELTAAERARMTLKAHPRRTSDLKAPFAGEGVFQDLTLEEFEMSTLPDAAWADYQQDGNKQSLATKHTLFFRAVFMPSLASALDGIRSGDAEALRIFGDRMEGRLKGRLATEPAAMNSFVQIIVLAKRSDPSSVHAPG